MTLDMLRAELERYGSPIEPEQTHAMRSRLRDSTKRVLDSLEVAFE